ncbi:MAG TPA: DUF1286 domain-containing protein [Nitrososphaerales archaeon]|nr:DUF1286 domain-containing protein [Nitrososphaerales archaeon]
MKSATHNLFSIGLMIWIVTLFGDPLVILLLLATVATVLTNALIDELGHANEDGVKRRTFLTHSVITAPFWGAAVWAIVLIIPAASLGIFPPDPVLLRFFASLGVLAAWSHLLLDSLTEGGVFVSSFQRRALAHFAYDNWPLNLGFSVLGVFLLFAALLA